MNEPDNQDGEGRTVEQEMAERLNELQETPETTETQETPAEGGTAEQPEAAQPATVEIDGKKYGEQEIRDLMRGSMMQADYTRKTQTMAEQRRALDMREQAMEGILKRYEEALARLSGGKSGPIKVDDSKLPPEVRQALAEERQERQRLADMVQGFQTERQEREQQAIQDRTNSFIVEHADSEIRSIMKAQGIPDSLFSIIRNNIAMEDPDTADPISGELTAESVKTAIRQVFGTVIKDLQSWKGNVVKELKKEQPKASSSTSKAATVTKPNQPGKKAWDDSDTIAAVMDRLGGANSGGDYI